MPDAERVRAELREIGERRKQQKLDEEALARDTARVVKRARNTSLPVTEVARLVGLDRAWLYRGFGI